MPDDQKPDTPAYPRRGKEPWITVKLTEEQRATVQQIALDLGGLSMSDAVRWLIKQVRLGRVSVLKDLPTDLQRTG